MSEGNTNAASGSQNASALSGASASGAAAASTAASGTGSSGGKDSGGSQNTTSLGTGGAGAQSTWRDTLPDDLKNDPILSKYSDLPNAAKALVEAQKAIGKKGIIKPSDSDSPEAWKAFREALGVPSAEKYELGKFEGIEFPKESIEFGKKMGAEIGILPQDMTKLMQGYAKFEMERNAAVDKEVKEIADRKMTELKAEWGEAYGPNLQKGLFAFQQIADLAGLKREDAMKWLDSGVGNDVVFIKFVQAASKLFGEDKLREGGVGTDRTSPAEIDNEISRVRQQLFNMKPTDGARPGVLAKFESLNKQRTGGR